MYPSICFDNGQWDQLYGLGCSWQHPAKETFWLDWSKIDEFNQLCNPKGVSLLWLRDWDIGQKGSVDVGMK